MGGTLSSSAASLLDPRPSSTSPFTLRQTGTSDIDDATTQGILCDSPSDKTARACQVASRDCVEASRDFIGDHERLVIFAEERRLAQERSDAVRSSKLLAEKLNRTLEALHDVESKLVKLLASPATDFPSHATLIKARSLVIMQALRLVDLLIEQSRKAILCAMRERHIVDRKAQTATNSEMVLMERLERTAGQLADAASKLEL